MDAEDSTRGPAARASTIGEPRGPLPEHQFAVWLMRTAAKRLGNLCQTAFVGPQYQRLAQFSGDMRTCWKSGLDVTRALELCLKPHTKTRLGEAWSSAVEQVRLGPLAWDT